MKFRALDEFGRIPLSKHFAMRQFLYSEISAVYGIPNVPDDLELALKTGSKLCEEILEPIVEMLGPIIVRSGYRSAALNAFGHQHRLRCASNEKNCAYHCWDRLDDNGHMGAAACIVIPSARDTLSFDQIDELALQLHDALPYHRMTFFRQHACLNIGWHEAPRREIFTYWPKPRWIRRHDQMQCPL